VSNRSLVDSDEGRETSPKRWKDHAILFPLKLAKRKAVERWRATQPLFYTQLQKAKVYVDAVGENFFKAGQAQLDLLKMNGCKPDSHVLEVGCGCLVAGRPIIEYLNPDCYVGIEPNRWLIEAVTKGLKGTKELIEKKRPIFLDNYDFDASATGRKFDFVIAHSVLSHAAHWQYPLFLKSLKTCLAPNGAILASIRFYNEAGEIAGDSNSEEWVYPGVSYFSLETVQRVAAEQGYDVEWRKDWREFFMSRYLLHSHDWIRLTLRPRPNGVG
jgi:cyclopropane fatty-acyl-phospholipid synthase-like methyltransferase